MKQNIIHIGLDVDDKPYHGSALNQITGETLLVYRSQLFWPITGLYINIWPTTPVRVRLSSNGREVIA